MTLMFEKAGRGDVEVMVKEWVYVWAACDLPENDLAY